jgi:predicted heme/steroid binding protein
MLVGDPSTGVSFKSLVSGLGLIYVPNTRTLNINGTTYDLSSNRSWSVGTVTSVNLIAGTGVSVSGGPITNSGSINIVNTAPDQVVSLTGGGTTTITGTYPNFTISSADSNVGTVTSVNMTVPTGLTISGNPITSAGTLALALASGYSIPTTANQANWTTAYNDSIVSAGVTGTSTKTLTLNQQDGGIIQASWSDIDTGLTSVGLSMPSAFAVSNSPLTSNGTLAVTGAGTSAQYVRGDGQLANFPANGGGGSSVNYYLNGSVNQGTFGGDTYYEMSKTPILGAGTNFTRTNAQGNGYIASFITDAGDPSLLNIPGGNWNLEFYFQSSASGGSPQFYAELYKVNASNVFTLVASGLTNPEGITNGTTVDQYFTSIPVPQTSLLVTDRLAVRIYVITSGRTITLHTEDGNLCEVLTTFSTGLNALNGLTAQVQYFATGTSGTDFAISSATDTHTFNLPIASATNTGKLSNSDWTTFINKQSAITLTTFNASGSATFVSSVLNIPTYTLVGLGGEPAITAGATTQYFRGDKTFVTLDTSVVPENSNLYFTDTRARNAITLTTTGSSGASTYSGGFLNIPIYSLSGLGGVPTTRTLTINGTTYDLSADRSWTIPVHDAVTIGTANGLSLSTQVLSLGLASSSANGALSSTDWSTFNGKQNTITLTTTGTSGAATLVGATLNIPQYADQFVGTVTSVAALTLGTTGTDLSSTVANGTTTPVITLNVPTASATNRGALSSGDWTTFNNKQAALNGTGFVKISGTTISYDNSTYYLASNPSAFIALTALTASSPLSYNNTTGAFTIAQASGSVNGFLSSTDWTTFNNKQNTITNPVTGTGTTNYLPKWTSGSALGNSLAQDTGSSINIGAPTTYPASKFVVSGSSANGAIVSEDTNSTSSFIRILGDATNGNLINYKNGTSLRFASSAADFTTFAEQMRLTSTGLGIGTTSPSYKLDVVGTGGFSGNLNSNFNALILSNSSSGNSARNILQFANNLGFNATIDLFGGGYVSSGGSDDVADAFRILSNGTGGMSIRANTGTLRFYTGSSERARIDTSGNLGLGVVPSAWNSPFKVMQVGGVSALWDISSVSGFSNNLYNDGTGRYLTSDYATIFEHSDGQFRWLTAPSGTAGNAISFTQAMTLSAGGDLGIANTSPSYRVDIEGSSGSISTVRVKNGAIGASDGSQILLGNSANFTNAYFRLNGGGNSSQGGAGSLNIGLTESAAMTFLTANTERLRITSGGNVGIGTSTPSYLLDVNRSSLGAIAQFITNDGTYNPRLLINGTTDGLQLFATFSSVAGALMLGTGNAERLRITSGGNVGIGTTSPSEKLHLVGNQKIDGVLTIATSSSTVLTINSTASAAYIGMSDSSGSYVYLGSDNGSVIFQTPASSYSTKMTLDSNGNLGIGTTTPGSKLSIVGLPTSATGLSAGDIWNDGGTLKIV